MKSFESCTKYQPVDVNMLSRCELIYIVFFVCNVLFLFSKFYPVILVTLL